MRLLIHSQSVAVLRLPPDAPHPDWAVGEPISSVTRTANQVSVVCPTTAVPDDIPGSMMGPFVAAMVDEVLEFSSVGIVVALLRPLADAGIPVLTLSTYDTDFVLLEASAVPTACAVWKAAGYEVVESELAIYPGREDDE